MCVVADAIGSDHADRDLKLSRPGAQGQISDKGQKKRCTELELPGVVAGYVASGPLVRRLDRRSVRPIVLARSAAAALAVLARELL